jgi:hypothetical protein
MWNEAFERMEGSLLGYKDWENDWHIANSYRPWMREAGIAAERRRLSNYAARMAAADRNGGRQRAPTPCPLCYNFLQLQNGPLSPPR